MIKFNRFISITTRYGEEMCYISSQRVALCQLFREQTQAMTHVSQCQVLEMCDLSNLELIKPCYYLVSEKRDRTVR